MAQVNQIIKKYDSNNFGIEVTTKNKSVTIKSFWGKFNQYQSLVKELRNNGYTVFE